MLGFDCFVGSVGCLRPNQGGVVEDGTDHARAPLLDGVVDETIEDDNAVCLFDLRVDKNETRNLAKDPDHQCVCLC